MGTAHYRQPYQKEKDYIQELFLSEIYTNVERIAFKGGTALSKFYESPRFSDDLDFSLLGGATERGLIGGLDKIIEGISGIYPLRILRKLNKKDITAYELSVRGPLFETLNKYQHLKLEIDKNASVVESTNAFRKNPEYADLRPYIAVVVGEREILAEKAVALLFRHNLKARDLFDMYFLIKKGVEVRVSLIDRKMRERGHVFAEERAKRRLDLVGGIWDKELRRLLPEEEFIGYDEAKKCVVESFKRAGLLG